MAEPFVEPFNDPVDPELVGGRAGGSGEGGCWVGVAWRGGMLQLVVVLHRWKHPGGRCSVAYVVGLKCMLAFLASILPTRTLTGPTQYLNTASCPPARPLRPSPPPRPPATLTLSSGPWTCRPLCVACARGRGPAARGRAATSGPAASPLTCAWWWPTARRTTRRSRRLCSRPRRCWQVRCVAAWWRRLVGLRWMAVRQLGSAWQWSGMPSVDPTGPDLGLLHRLSPHMSPACYNANATCSCIVRAHAWLTIWDQPACNATG